jgi:hypothetical protein
MAEERKQKEDREGKRAIDMGRGRQTNRRVK